MRVFTALKDRFVEKIIPSLAFTGVLYLYAIYRDIFIEQAKYILKAGTENFPVVLTNLMQQYMNNILPIIVFWLLLGILCYFFFFLLQNIYYHFENAVAVKLFFTKPIFLRKNNDGIFFMKRIAIHLFVIFAFILVAIIMFLGLIPLSLLVQKAIENISYSGTYLIISIVVNFAYWYVVFTIFHILAVNLNDAIICNDLEEEHTSKN